LAPSVIFWRHQPVASTILSIVVEEAMASWRLAQASGGTHDAQHEHDLGMKTERKWTELSGATFVFIFLCRSKNKYRNTRNKYENGYFQK
jgi:hypothetical protein